MLCEVNPQLHLTCVDPWSAYPVRSQEVQDRNYSVAVEALAGLNVSIKCLSSMEFVGVVLDGSLDFVFIDGDHSFENAMLDILMWSKKVKSGGIVAVHDYHPFCGMDVILAVNAYTRANHIDPWYVTREMEPTAFWVHA